MPATLSKSKTYTLAVTALMSAVICVIAPWSLPIGPIPISLCTLALYLSVYLLPWQGAVTATLVYILIGVVGLPVFSGFSGGLGKVLGPTGGYIVGYIPLVLVCGLFIKKFQGNRVLQLCGMVLGTAVLYILGTAWFCVQSGNALAAALGLCVVPFIPGDGAKMLVALVIGPMLCARLVKAGLLEA